MHAVFFRPRVCFRLFASSPAGLSLASMLLPRAATRPHQSNGNLHHGRLRCSAEVLRARPPPPPVAQQQRRHRAAAAVVQAQQQQQPPDDPGLQAFVNLIADKRFFCTQCGKCCTGDGEVWITDEEAVNISRHLGLPLKRFLAQHTHGYSKVEGFRLLRSDMTDENRPCTFLRPDNTCAIHPVRPLQCSTYPWWPDLMQQEDWSWEKEHICEGFDHPDAPPTDLHDAARQLRWATALEYRKRIAYKPGKKQRQQAQQQQQQQQAVQQQDEGPRGSGEGGGGSTKPPAWQERLRRLEQQLAAEE